MEEGFSYIRSFDRNPMALPRAMVVRASLVFISIGHLFVGCSVFRRSFGFVELRFGLQKRKKQD